MKLNVSSLSLHLKAISNASSQSSSVDNSVDNPSKESKQESKLILSPELKRMYNSEQLINFRHIYRLLATKSKYTLTEADIAPPCVNRIVNAIGQFAELSWGRVSAPFVWGHLEDLGREGFPLDRRIYDALPGSILLDSFYGTVAKVHAYVIYRKGQATYEGHDQLVLCFSGTDGPNQALRDIKTNYHRYRHFREDGCLIKTDLIVHSGFWGMFKGVRSRMQIALRQALTSYPEVKEIVIGGHSLGGALAYLFCLDLLQQKQLTALIEGRRTIVAAFGAPRVGNQALVDHWKRLLARYREAHGPTSFQEISVKAYFDGVPTLPMTSLGYRHFADKPYYLYGGNLFEIPTAEKELCYFPVVVGEHYLQPGGTPHYPRGGHNYYGRDFEKLGRSMEWIDAASRGEVDWERRYIKKRDKWDKKWTAKYRD